MLNGIWEIPEDTTSVCGSFEFVCPNSCHLCYCAFYACVLRCYKCRCTAAARQALLDMPISFACSHTAVTVLGSVKCHCGTVAMTHLVLNAGLDHAADS